MENDNVDDLKKELATKTKIPKDVREKIYAKIFKEIGMAILIFLYFLLLNMGYTKLEKDVFSEDLHNFAGILAISTVIVFEIAYKKDNGEIALHGVELLVLAVITLFMPYIYFYRGIAVKFLYSFSSMYIAIYYSIKSLFVYEREVKKYKAELSDVKEIVANSEKSYLDEKNERKFKEDDEIDNIVSRNRNLKAKVEKLIRQNRKMADKAKSKFSDSELMANVATEAEMGMTEKESATKGDGVAKLSDDVIKTEKKTTTRKPRAKKSVAEGGDTEKATAKKTTTRKPRTKKSVAEGDDAEKTTEKKTTTRKPRTKKSVAKDDTVDSDENAEVAKATRAKTRAVSSAGSTDGEVKKSTRGRKKKVETEEKAEAVEQPVRKKRGRPRKIKDGDGE